MMTDIPARCGDRRENLFFRSCRGRSPKRVGNGAAHGGADPHRESVRVSHLRTVPFLECDSMVPDILSGRSERMSAKKGSAAARFRPKLGTVSADRPQLAPFGRSDTASRLHAEAVPSFPLRGRPPTERAGSWTNVRLIAHTVRASFPTRTVLSCWGRPT